MIHHSLLKSKEAKVSLSIFVILLSINVLLLITEEYLSGNIKHIKSIPQITRELSKKNSRNVLMIGNSLLNDGVDRKTFEMELGQVFGQDVHSLKINPDGSSIWVWHYLYKNLIEQKSFKPDLILIHFAWGQLSDNFTYNPSELGYFFCATNDLLELSEIGTFNFGDQCEFLLAKALPVFAHREAISKRILDLFVPDYRINTQRINNARRERKVKHNHNLKGPKHYRLLKRFITLMEDSGAKIAFVAMPVVEDYQIENELKMVLSDNNTYLVDCRKMPLIEEQMYKDSIHLNKAASFLFTKYLVQRLRTDIYSVHPYHARR